MQNDYQPENIVCPERTYFQNRILEFNHKNKSRNRLCCYYNRWSLGGINGTHGIFTLDNSEDPKNAGDPVDYPRKTEYDNHFHDCDEYWVFYQGSCTAVSEGKKYEVEPGFCIATEMGDHHDIPEVHEEVHAVWFQSSLKGMMREGHLWVHTHGEPSPEL